MRRGGPPGAANSGQPPRRDGRRRARTSWRLTAALLAGRVASALSRRPGPWRRHRHRRPRRAAHRPERPPPPERGAAPRRDPRLGHQRQDHHHPPARTLLGGQWAAHRPQPRRRQPAHRARQRVAQAADRRGRPRADVGLFEVDEATVPHALPQTRPRVVLLTNIFRDQLDRYGEVHFVADLWRDGARSACHSTATSC